MGPARRRLYAVAAALALMAPASHGAAETDAQWTPNAQNKPETCADIWRDIGLPAYAFRRPPDAMLVCHKRFVLSHNNPNRAPDWVVEHLEKAQFTGAFERPPQAFVQEPRVRPSARMADDDYPLDRYGLARGHMAPSEDFNNNEDDMKASFILSNAVPQVADRFNSSIWRQLEREVRIATTKRDSLYVITGPIHGLQGRRTRTIPASVNACGRGFALTGPQQPRACAANRSNPNLACGAAGELIPVGLYKIVYDDKKKVAYAFIMPNMEHPSHTGDDGRAYLNTFRATVATVEWATGVRFLRGIPAGVQNDVINKCASDMLWPPVPQHAPSPLGASPMPTVEEEDPAMGLPPWLRQPQPAAPPAQPAPPPQ